MITPLQPEIKVDIYLLQDLDRPLCPTKAPCKSVEQSKTIAFPTKSGTWYKAGSVEDVYGLLEDNKEKSTRLVVGNTANGTRVIYFITDRSIDCSFIS